MGHFCGKHGVWGEGDRCPFCSGDTDLPAPSPLRARAEDVAKIADIIHGVFYRNCAERRTPMSLQAARAVSRFLVKGDAP
jgi:hypothetical protein